MIAWPARDHLYAVLATNLLLIRRANDLICFYQIITICDPERDYAIDANKESPLFPTIHIPTAFEGFKPTTPSADSIAGDTQNSAMNVPGARRTAAVCRSKPTRKSPAQDIFPTKGISPAFQGPYLTVA